MPLFHMYSFYICIYFASSFCLKNPLAFHDKWLNIEQLQSVPTLSLSQCFKYDILFCKGKKQHYIQFHESTCKTICEAIETIRCLFFSFWFIQTLLHSIWISVTSFLGRLIFKSSYKANEGTDFFLISIIRRDLSDSTRKWWRWLRRTCIRALFHSKIHKTRTNHINSLNLVDVCRLRNDPMFLRSPLPLKYTVDNPHS